MKCPACGQGKLFYRYLKVYEACTVCHQKLASFPADDAPAYLSIFWAAHVLIPFFLYVDTQSTFSMPLFLLGASGVTVISLLCLLPLMKGAVIGVLCYLSLEASSRASSPEE